MRWSNFFLPTLREDPREAEAISHKLMLRAGLIRRLGSGAYSYLPFGHRALQKTISIIREEMNQAGGQEVLMPALQPIELWKATGRADVLGDVLIKFKDRTGKEIALGPTHEEVVTDLVKEIQSHKQLPITLFQIQTKFRDEPRPRFGVIRSKEFIMKDAYSFDLDVEGLNRSYQTMYEAYRRIFSRCGLSVLVCEADPGIMGGDVSHEFMAPAENGEDRIVRCVGCGYAANLEAAKCPPAARGGQAPESLKPLEKVNTPNQHTVEQVSKFLKVSPAKLIKTLVYDVEDEHVAVLVRGDHDVNEAKLSRLLKTQTARLSSAGTIERLTGAPMGFTGPVKLKGIRLVADHAVLGVVNGVTGANEAEAHLINVNPGRDFKPGDVADLRIVVEDDVCPKCGKNLEFVRVIEVGHVFKLGTKYTKALGVTIQDASGAVKPIVMGCYGIGVNRILAAVIEQNHDAQGLSWPVSLAPFRVLVSVLEMDSASHRKAGEEVYDLLCKEGIDVLLDHRDQSPGSKLKDADLVGIPIQVVIGKNWKRDGRFEIRVRATTERMEVGREDLLATIHKLLDKRSS